MNHIITTKNGQGKALKCLHCNRFSRLKLKKGLMNYAKELADFERIHQYCQPQADGRGLRYAKPTQPVIGEAILCEGCNKVIEKGDAKIPLYRTNRLNPIYTHPDCLDELIAFVGKWVNYRIGHHNLVVQSECEWLYFWQGRCGSARNKAEAGRLLGELSEGVGL